MNALQQFEADVAVFGADERVAYGLYNENVGPTDARISAIIARHV